MIVSVCLSVHEWYSVPCSAYVTTTRSYQAVFSFPFHKQFERERIPPFVVMVNVVVVAVPFIISEKKSTSPHLNSAAT